MTNGIQKEVIEHNPEEIMDALTLERLEIGGFCEGCSDDLWEMCTPCLLKVAHDCIKSLYNREVGDLHKIAIWVCEDCITATGEMCHMPGCIFIRQSVREWAFHPGEYEILDSREAPTPPPIEHKQ